MASQPSLYPYAHDYTTRIEGLDDKPFARGGYSNVYIARLQGEKIAIKELHSTDDDELAQAEYNLWQRLRHPNILQLKGICYLHDNRRVPSFISRWQKHGRILDFIRENPDVDFLQLIEGIAEAVSYLHRNNIIHGDLRAANILIGDDGEALVTDFGIAKQYMDDGIQVTKALLGNYRWMAPESVTMLGTTTSANFTRRSKQSDIWMFGMLMQEILSGAYPYHGIKSTAQVLAKLGSGELPSFPLAQHVSWRKFDEPVRALANRCCAIQCGKRPDIQNVIEEIRKVS